MPFLQRRFWLVTAGLVLLTPFVVAAGARPAQPRLAVHTGGAEGDLKILRATLEKLPAVQFKADEIKFGDFKRDGGLFTGFFSIEIKDLAKTDIGAIAKALAAANTSNKEKTPAALYLVLKYRPDSVKTEQLRAVLAKVKGVRAEKSWAGDANLWVSVDDSGQARLSEITRALHQADIKFRDPTDTSEQP